MKCACIIEQDPDLFEEIKTTLSQIDSQLKIFSFENLEEFHKWVIENITRIKENPKTEKIDLKLIIGDIEFLGPRYFTLVEKIKKLFVRRGFCTEQDPTQIILTAFDSPNLDHKKIESRVINNVIFKPFDKAILQQHLRVALSGHNIISESTVFKQKVKAQAEMLKEVPLIDFSEIGFKTTSNREIPLNNVSKYYGSHFIPNGNGSVFAKCVKCEPHLTNSNEFIAFFEYFDISNNKSKFLRQSLFKDHDLTNANSSNNSSSPQSGAKILTKKLLESNYILNFVAIIDPNQNNESEIKESLIARFNNINFKIYDNFDLFSEEYKKIPTPINAVFISQNYILKDNLDTWKNLTTEIKNNNSKLLGKESDFNLFSLNYKEFNEKEKREYVSLLNDSIHLPVDRIYLYKRMIGWYTQLQTIGEPILINHKTTEEIFSVANPVDLVDISEAGLSIKYYREISYNSFRRFCLNRNNEDEALEIVASCYFYEKDKSNGNIVNYFVFFGITDHYLKFIRKWILDCYIETKKTA